MTEKEAAIARLQQWVRWMEDTYDGFEEVVTEQGAQRMKADLKLVVGDGR